MWECGLKHFKTVTELHLFVTPYVGVWIETASKACPLSPTNVTPYVGVWIETTVLNFWSTVCESHSLCGSVD